MRVLAFAFLIVAAFSEEFETPDYYGSVHTKVFKQWVTHLGKKYDSILEGARRFVIFSENWRDVHNTNQQGLAHSLGLNQFADLTADEFKYYVHGKSGSCLRQGQKSVRLPSEWSTSKAAPASVDSTTEGVVTPVKNQGQCGSCWSYYSTGSIESATAIKTGKLVSLSGQQLVDCSRSYGNLGYTGGLMDDALKCVKAEGGFCSKKEYPYKARKTCAIKFDAISGYTNVTHDSEQALMNAVAMGQVSIAIAADQSAGVLNGNCGTQLVNDVLAVGYGTGGGNWGEEQRVLIGNKNGRAGEYGISVSLLFMSTVLWANPSYGLGVLLVSMSLPRVAVGMDIAARTAAAAAAEIGAEAPHGPGCPRMLCSWPLLPLTFGVPVLVGGILYAAITLGMSAPHSGSWVCRILIIISCSVSCCASGLMGAYGDTSLVYDLCLDCLVLVLCLRSLLPCHSFSLPHFGHGLVLIFALSLASVRCVSQSPILNPVPAHVVLADSYNIPCPDLWRSAYCDLRSFQAWTAPTIKIATVPQQTGTGYLRIYFSALDGAQDEKNMTRICFQLVDDLTFSNGTNSANSSDINGAFADTDLEAADYAFGGISIVGLLCSAWLCFYHWRRLECGSKVRKCCGREEPLLGGGAEHRVEGF